MSIAVFLIAHVLTYRWFYSRPIGDYIQIILQIPTIIIQVVLMIPLFLLAKLYSKEEKRIVAKVLSFITLGISVIPSLALMVFALLYALGRVN
jgi:hypothetical protein